MSFTHFSCRIIPAWYCGESGVPTFRALGSIADSWVAWDQKVRRAGKQEVAETLQKYQSIPSATREFPILKAERPDAQTDYVNTGLGVGRLSVDAPHNNIRISLLPVVQQILGKMFVDDYPTFPGLCERVSQALATLRNLLQALKGTPELKVANKDEAVLGLPEADARAKEEQLSEKEAIVKNA